MAISQLAQNCKIRTLKIVVGYADLAVAATTNDIEIYSMPAKGHVLDCWIDVTETFLGGAIASYTLSLGVAGALADLMFAGDSFTATTILKSYGAAKDDESYVKSNVATTSIRIAATSTVGNLNVATQGIADVYLIVAEWD